MKNVKVLVLGGGASGLAVSLSLVQRGFSRDDIVVLEQEAVAGGLCRSDVVDGAPLDIGGGHFLDVRKRNVLDLLFRFMPEEEWDRYARISTIRLRGQSIDYPLEANLWQLAVDDQVEFLDSIAHAGCVAGAPMPASFADWVTWKLGTRIAEDYMLPYNRKIWSTDLDALGTYWLYKLPDVSFRDTLRSCLERRPAGSIPAHGTFLYPKRHGYGEVWRRMGEALGESLVTRCAVESIDVANRIVNGRWKAETIVSTIPWTLWPERCRMPEDVRAAVARLRNASIDVDYVPETLTDPSHWIYEPDEAVSYHRLLLRSNFSKGSRGHWTETNAARSGPAAGWRHRNEFAYPLNTRGKPEAVEHVLGWAARHGIVGAGRWGRWEHMNSDVAVDEGMQLAGRLCGKAVAR
jgi:protoporphyrinogen oxidase